MNHVNMLTITLLHRTIVPQNNINQAESAVGNCSSPVITKKKYIYYFRFVVSFHLRFKYGY